MNILSIIDNSFFVAATGQGTTHPRICLQTAQHFGDGLFWASLRR